MSWLCGANRLTFDQEWSCTCESTIRRRLAAKCGFASQMCLRLKEEKKLLNLRVWPMLRYPMTTFQPHYLKRVCFSEESQLLVHTQSYWEMASHTSSLLSHIFLHLMFPLLKYRAFSTPVLTLLTVMRRRALGSRLNGGLLVIFDVACKSCPLYIWSVYVLNRGKELFLPPFLQVMYVTKG